MTKLDAEETVIEEKNVIVTDATPQGVHGGAWKVAYADFVTAMMAFFLLMWLLNATTEEQRSGIADYFDPKIPISQSSSGGMGMFNGDSVFAQNKLARNGLGGAGKKASAGRDDKQKHEVSSSEDVWRQGEAKSEFIGNSKFVGAKGDGEKGAATDSTGNSDKDLESEMIETEIKRQIEQISPGEGLSEQLNFKMTDEGLRIDITDNGGIPMFQSGSGKPTAKMKQIMSVVGSVVSELENEISITGHTDATPFRARRNYSNWELSSDRAHAARRSLLETGMDPSRIKRVEGRASREPIVAENPDDPMNRRIGIVLLRDTSKDAMMAEHRKNQEEKNMFEQERLIRNDKRAIGKKGASHRELFIPDQRSFN